MQPEVSIIIPSYNHEKYIGYAIESVISQTFSNWELIIIDDGSTDNSVEIIKKYNDSRIKLIEQLNHDAPYAINRGMRESAGKYIAILNSDDIFHREKLQESIAVLSNKYDFTFGKLSVIDENNNVVGEENDRVRWINEKLNNSKEEEDINKLFSNINYVVASSNFVFKRELMDKIGYFHEKLHYGHDYNYLIRIFEKGLKVKFIPKILTSYRIHSKNTLSTGIYEAYMEAYYSIAILFRSGSPALAGLKTNFFKSPIVPNALSFLIALSDDEFERIVSHKDDVNRNKLLKMIKGLAESYQPYISDDYDGSDLEEVIKRKNREIRKLQEELFVVRNSLRWKVSNFLYKKSPPLFGYLGRKISRYLSIK